MIPPPRFVLCRADFLLPLAAPDRTERIADGYVLSEGEVLREVGRYTPEIGRRIRAACGSELLILGDAVADDGVPTKRINELECVDGEVYANVWYEDRIARISPTSGQVLGWIDLSGLFPAARRPHHDAVLNGIAYDAARRRLFVTGKNWPQLFEIRLVAP